MRETYPSSAGGDVVGQHSTSDLTFGELTAWLRRHAFGIAAGMVTGLVAGLLSSVQMPRIYRSQVVLSPNLDTLQGSALSDLAGQFGGLASLAGVRLPSGGNKDEAIELLKSRGFAARFIADLDLLPRLFEQDWDSSLGAWAVVVDEVPTINDGVERFVTRIRRVQEDRGSGMVTLTIDWVDREEAARWAGEMVTKVNDELRARAVNEAEGSLAFLQSQAEQTTVVPVKEAMYKLIESQMKTVMLANVRTDYAFRVIDPPVVADADDYISPNRVLNSFLGAFFGAAAGIAVSVLFRPRRTRPSRKPVA